MSTCVADLLCLLVYLCCTRVVSTCIVHLQCLPVLHTWCVDLRCTHAVSTCIVQMLCLLVLYTCCIYLYCRPAVSTCIVGLLCLPVLLVLTKSISVNNLMYLMWLRTSNVFPDFKKDSHLDVGNITTIFLNKNNCLIYLTNAHLVTLHFSSTSGHYLLILFIDVYMTYITSKTHSHWM